MCMQASLAQAREDYLGTAEDGGSLPGLGAEFLRSVILSERH